MTRHHKTVFGSNPQNIKIVSGLIGHAGRINLRSSGSAWVGAIIILAMSAMAFYSSAAASTFSRSSAGSTTNESGFLVPRAEYSRTSFLQLTPPESVETFQSNCTTPSTTFVLGDTVCGVATGAPTPVFGFRQRRFQWITPTGILVQQTDVTTDPQNDPFTIPTTGPFALVGTWTLRLVRNNGATAALTRFVVRDPSNLRADLQIAKLGELQVPAGTNSNYTIIIKNQGPDAATSVQFTDTVPANMTFVAEAQNVGPTFNCTNPPSGGTGTTTCTLGSLASGDSATFTLIYAVGAGTPSGTQIFNTATVSSATVELSPTDNSSTAPITVTSNPGGGGQCVMSCPSNVTVNNTPNQFGAIVNYPAPTGTGSSCGAITSIPASGTFFDVGATNVTAVGETGNPCNFTVTVVDAQTPTISCPSDITVSEDAPGSNQATVNYPAPVVNDNDPNVVVTSTPASGSTFTAGTTVVTATATDTAGLTASCTFNVTVIGTACTLSCPSDIVVNNDVGSCGAIVSFPAPTTTGACDAVTLTHASGSFFPIGTTTVTASTSGESCSFHVTVIDRPVINCPANITVNLPSGSCSTNVSVGTPTASDSCPGSVSVVGTRSDGAALNAPYTSGVTTIVWTATNSAGNSSICLQTITLNDNTPPTLSVPAVAGSISSASCPGEIPDLIASSNPKDNCNDAETLTIVQSPAAGTPVADGTYTVTVTATDTSGNSTSGTSQVTVGALSAVGPASIWLGLKNSDDVGTKFDLLAEVFRNDVLVSSSTITNVPGGSSGFNNAVQRVITPFSALGAGAPCPPNTMSIRLSVKITAVGGHTSGTARLWFNDSAANSRFNAVIGGVTIPFYLRNEFPLALTPGPGPKSTIDVFVNRNVGGNPWVPFGTWTMAF